MGKFLDITGQRFGRLIALQPVDKDVRGKIRWLCQCDCNRRTCIVSRASLRSNGTRSCGCLVKENRGLPKHGHARHGEYHPLYTTWQGMRARCNNPNHRQYKDYGGRGIKVEDLRWDDFSIWLNDILTTIGPRPPGMVLDRIDNEAGYKLNNIKWSTYIESNNNRRPGKREVGRSGLRGVRQQRDRWRTVIYRDGKGIHVGMFPTIEFARAAYCDAAKRLHDDPYMVIDATYHEAIDRLLDEAEWNRIESTV